MANARPDPACCRQDNERPAMRAGSREIHRLPVLPVCPLLALRFEGRYLSLELLKLLPERLRLLSQEGQPGLFCGSGLGCRAGLHCLPPGGHLRVWPLAGQQELGARPRPAAPATTPSRRIAKPHPTWQARRVIHVPSTHLNHPPFVSKSTENHPASGRIWTSPRVSRSRMSPVPTATSRPGNACWSTCTAARPVQ